MATEIEHKYLVADDGWRKMAVSALELTQGYLCRDVERVVRVRLTVENGGEGRGFITIKGRTVGVTRLEMEYEIPADDARQLLALCVGPIVSKTRHIVPFGGHRWELDEFHGRHEGLVLAEIELPTADTHYDLPLWVGSDVTGDPRYYNSNLE